MRTFNRLLSAIALTAFYSHRESSAAPLHALPEGQKLPKDRRLEPLKDLNGYFPFAPPKDAKQWQRRAAGVKRRILVANGLWPLPTKTPLNAVVHGRIDRKHYTIEKTYFESFPGFYVTGSLYRPKGKSGKRPGVLCPHGHWSNGRFYDSGESYTKREIQQGAEKFPAGGRSPLQARCVHLARMGYVVFHYDMIGYADSTQITSQIAHGFKKQRPEMNTDENWGLFSPQAESHLQSVMGMQTYNSIRAVDFLLSLPDVDAERIGVTGASGGGTQSMILGAIDPRIAVSMPAVMVSTAMQGGCTCENCSLMRIGTGNVEFAALFAPKPIGLTAANDWTKEMATKGFPQLRQLYEALGATGNVTLASHVEFGHNYNAVCRAAMYRWFNKHLDVDAPIEEREFKRLTQAEMTVWDDKHPRPKGGEDFERGLVRWWYENSEKQLAALSPENGKELDQYRETVGGGLNVVLGSRLPRSADVAFENTNKKDNGSFLEIAGLVRNRANGSELPTLFLHPKQWDGKVVIWIAAEGKAGMYENDGAIRSAIRGLIAAGVTVVGVDLFQQGEFLTDRKPIDKTRRVKNPRESAAYTFGYNHSVCAQRIHDILTVITFVQNHELEPEEIHLVGLAGAGHWVAAARAQARDVISRTAIDTAGFRFAKVRDLHDPNFLPGGAKYGDLPGMLSLAAPGQLWLAGEGTKPHPMVTAAYKAAGAVKNLAIHTDKKDDKTVTATRWLLGR
ncbi:MAG: alpha/beta hydrolase family protein [Pirellulales bacterium]